ncbi:MAG: aminotransferase class V-fold PLP-dependent enzyme [Actinomycetota bacterium]|nr:aminotransferase class V-fold PLP-dependent enzyme [Actinomycetota bacterium]
MRGPEDLLAWRAEFPAVENRTFLGMHTLAPLSRRARAAVDRFLDAWETKASAEVVWFEDILPEMRRLESLYARLIGADDDEIALTPSVSTGLSSLASCIRFDERNEIVLSRKEFPTDCHVWLAQEERGGHVVWVDDMRADSYLNAIGSRTAVCSASRVSYLNGELLDAKKVVDACRDAGVFSVIDDFHGSATVLIDVHNLGTDALVAGPLKYMLGGPGIAFVYVRAGVAHTLKPTVTGWFSQANFFEFDNAKLSWPDNAQRLALGTPSPAAIYAAAAGLEIILEVGVARIRERTQELIDYALAKADDAKFSTRTPRDSARRGGIATIEVESSKHVLEQLLKRGVIIDERHGALRLSPSFYTSEDDIDRFFEELVAVQ